MKDNNDLKGKSEEIARLSSIISALGLDTILTSLGMSISGSKEFRLT
jgi:hypothetical protein